MRYHTRQKFKLGCKLATERITLQIKNKIVNQWKFLRNRIKWQTIADNGDNKISLYEYSRVGKFNHICYLVSKSDIDWYKSEKPFENKNELLAEADEILKNNIYILGFGRVSYKKKIEEISAIF